MIVEGIHMHTGSDIMDIDVFLQGAEILLSVAKDFKDLQYVDFGSGFKVPYKEEDIETDIEELGEKIGNRFKQFCYEYGRNLTLKTLGRIANALEEDFEFIAVRDVQELKAQPKLRDSVSRLEELRQQWDAIESPWVDRTANDNRFPWKHAA